eukprot:m.178554 g.178554  ORF g.178554 m.178554 type:complete len:381 (+) comp17982_c1_seq2:409-1551(+)
MALRLLPLLRAVRSATPRTHQWRGLSATTAAAATDEVLFEEHGNTRTIVLNRPKALNALSLPMIRTIHPQLKAWDEDEEIGVVIIKGAGEKAFCAGGDVVSLVHSRDTDGELCKSFFREEYQLDYCINTLRTPYVALLDGITMGGGVGLSVNGMFRVATERSLFAMPETAIGLFPDVGGSYFLPRLPGSLGMYLALTGARLKGEDLVHAGIATQFVPSDNLDDLETKLHGVSGRDVAGVEAILHAARAASGAPPSYAEQLDDINHCFSAPTLDGVFQRLKELDSEWGSKLVAKLEKMAPSSMKITFSILQKGASMSLADCLVMEYRVTQGIMARHDFFEGVRAVLIDKDHSPTWEKTLSEITDEEIEQDYFQPLSYDLQL